VVDVLALEVMEFRTPKDQNVSSTFLSFSQFRKLFVVDVLALEVVEFQTLKAQNFSSTFFSFHNFKNCCG
jgi:hypothetical protein